MSENYFAYDPDQGFETYATAELAEAAAKSAIAYYAENSDEGWCEEVEEVVWGEIRGHSAQVKIKTCVNYELAAVAAYTSDPLADLAAVMRHHNITIDSNGCGAIRDGSSGTHHLFIWQNDEVLVHKFTKENDAVKIKADDITEE